MTGYLRRIRLDFDRGWLKAGVYESSDDMPLRDMGNSWNEYEGLLFQYCPDLGLRVPNDGADYFYFPITISAVPQSNTRESSRNIAGLLLRPASVDGQYRRCGTLDLTDMFALKMRYRVRASSQPTDTDWEELQQKIRQAFDAGLQDAGDSDEDDWETVASSETSGENFSFPDPEDIYKFDQNFEPKWLERLKRQRITLV